jgi:hypothetical protein
MIINYFFLKLYRILLFLRRDDAGAKHSAFLYLSAYTSLFILSVINCAGREMTTSVSHYMVTPHLPIWITVFILVPLILYFSYYRNISPSRIESSYNALRKINRLIIDLIIYLLIIGIPVSTFLLY